MRLRGNLLLAIVSVASLLLASCAAPLSAPQTAPAQPAATPRPAVVAPPPGPSGNLNIALVSLGTENWIPRMVTADERPMWELLMDPPVGVSPNDGLTPDLTRGLVEEWSIKESGEDVTLTLKFRKGVPFHKGEGTATAKDFKFTWAEYMREGSRSPGATAKGRLIDRNLNNIEVVDDHTAIIRSKRKWAAAGFEAELTLPIGRFDGLIPEAYFTRIGGEEEYRKAPISTGPFQFVEWRSNQLVRLEAVPGHWRKTPAYKTVTISKVPEPATQLAQLLSGQVDIIQLAPRQLAEIKGRGDVDIMRVKDGGEIFTNLGGIVNPQRKTYDSSVPWVGEDVLGERARKVRQAMSIAINRKAIIDRLLFGQGREVAVPFLFDRLDTPWYNPQWRPLEYDPKKAKQLLAEAGYPQGFSLKALVFPLPYNPANADVQEAIAGAWEEIGIKVERQLTEYTPTVRAKIVDRTHAGYVYTYTQSIGFPPYNYLGQSCCFTTRSVLAHWEVPWVDQTMEKAYQTYDPVQRNAIMREVGDFLYKNHIGVPIASINVMWAVRKDKVKKWEPVPAGGWLRNVEYLEKP